MQAAFVAERAEYRLANTEAQAEAAIGHTRVQAEAYVAELEGTHVNKMAALEHLAAERAAELGRTQARVQQLMTSVQQERYERQQLVANVQQERYERES